MASIVVMRLPVTAETGVMHERTGLPSTWIVHAPHNARPQPNFVPVIPRTSRTTHSIGVSSSTSTLCVFPLIVMVKAMTVSPLFCQRHKKRRWDQTRRAKVNLLDDGIGRYVGVSRRGNRAARGPRPRHQGMMDARLRSGASSLDGVMARWLGTN